MFEHKGKANSHSNAQFKERYQAECQRVNRFMTWLMIAQWVAGIAFAAFFSPLTWIGNTYQPHIHIWAAVLLGGAISGCAVACIRRFPNHARTRHVVAAAQMLWSALLIHLSGGRIETHFHVFASLAILSIYRDWKILVTATVVVAIDHFARGIFYPMSAFGVALESPFRWMEHAAWVLFEVAFLAPGCMRLRNEIYELCVTQSRIEKAKQSVDIKVQKRTAELTKSHQLLAQKTEEAEKLALVARYTDNGVVVADSEGRIEWVNAGFKRITGYSLKEVRGKRPSEFLHGPKTDPVHSRQIQSAFENKHGFNLEVIKYKKSGEPFWMAVESKPIRDSNGDAVRFVMIESDITERIEAERERQYLNEQLVDASRAAGIAEVATGVLHNVGNVLNSVNVSASVIHGHVKKSAVRNLEKVSGLIEENLKNFEEFVSTDNRGKKIPEYVVKVSSALQDERTQMQAELDDLLDNIEHIKEIVAVQQASAKTSGLMQTLSPGKLVNDSIKANKGTLANHAIRIRKEISDEVPDFESDKSKIIQILVNLIRNAKDALKEAEIIDPEITLRVEHDENCVMFDVIDNGIGICQEDLNKIFQHGFTTKDTGHGFGLHASANAATELGGSLVVSSEGLGKGAMFRLTLPIAGQQLSQEHENSQAAIEAEMVTE